jgi:molybdopterin converting factor subunit 1
MKIKLFATLKERANADEIVVHVAQDLTVRELRQVIATQHPTLAALVPQTLVAVNQQFAFNSDTIHDTDEVALFPPVSGGSGETEYPTLLRITHEPIDLNALQCAVATEHDGAVVIFTGIVRKYSAGEITLSLEYEAYTEMALAKLRQLAAEMRRQFGAIHGIALVQRVGQMQVGEPTVAVVIGAGHRGDGAFEAARYGIDRLKQIVPVWKRETRPDGANWLEGDYTPQPGD